jgi:SAM-dependent methyltransferase
VLELGCGSGLVSAGIASLGHTVVALDITPEAAASARRVAAEVPDGRMSVVEGDFFEVDLPEDFDVVCYFDGFGIGSDADQRRLLRRIAGWLGKGGCATIDVYAPWEAFRDSGEEYEEGAAMGRQDFDADGSRSLGPIWPTGDESQAVTQSLRCYSPADLRLLLESTGLALETYEPYEDEYHETRVPLEQALLYLTKLVPED